MRSLPLLLAILLQQDDKPAITIRLESAPLAEVFAEITKQSGVAFEVDASVARDRITIRLDKVSPFAAADAICRAHGKIRLDFPTYARKALVRPGTPAKGPVCDRGDFLFRIQQIVSVRTQTFDDAPARGLTVHILAAWSGDPVALGPVELTEAKDDSGRDLLKELPDRKTTFPKTSLAELVQIPLQHPREGARKISVKGRREAVFASETRTLRLPVDALPAKDGPLALTKIARAETGLTAVFEFAPDGEKIVPGPDRFRDLRFAGSDGKTYRAQVTTSTTGPERVTFEVIVRAVPKEATIVACEAVFVVKYEVRTVTFEFKDVELP